MGRFFSILILLVLLIFGAWYAWQHTQKNQAPEADAAETAPVAVEPAAIVHPVPAQASAQDEGTDEVSTAKPIPTLSQSDPAFREELSDVAGAGPVEAFLVPRNLIQKMVVTINSLTGEPVQLRQRPVPRVQGIFETTKTSTFHVISPVNSPRYDRHVAAFDAVGTSALVSLYFRYYPLFQEAYEEIGYEGQYFNDRVVAVIDHLLAVPKVEEPIQLVRPKVVYLFADPELEKLSSGHKTLLRIGEEHRQTVLAKLTAIRAEIVSRTAEGSE